MVKIFVADRLLEMVVKCMVDQYFIENIVNF